MNGNEKKIPVPEIPRDPRAAEEMLAALQAKKKFLGLVGIAMKAGKVSAGTNLVVDAIRAGSPAKCPRAVFLCEDASDNTKKRVVNACTYYEIPLYTIPVSGADLGGAIGKSGIIAAVGITDAGLSEALVKQINASEGSV